MKRIALEVTQNYFIHYSLFNILFSTTFLHSKWISMTRPAVQIRLRNDYGGVWYIAVTPVKVVYWTEAWGNTWLSAESERHCTDIRVSSASHDTQLYPDRFYMVCSKKRLIFLFRVWHGWQISQNCQKHNYILWWILHSNFQSWNQVAIRSKIIYLYYEQFNIVNKPNFLFLFEALLPMIFKWANVWVNQIYHLV